MTRFIPIVLALATVTAAAPQLETLHNSRGVYIAQDDDGQPTFGLDIKGGSWLVITPYGSGQIVGGALDGIEATEAIYFAVTGTPPIFAAPNPHPNPQSPILQCIAAAHQACAASEGCTGGICELTCDLFNVKCKQCDGSCRQVSTTQGMLMLYLLEGE